MTFQLKFKKSNNKKYKVIRISDNKVYAKKSGNSH